MLMNPSSVTSLRFLRNYKITPETFPVQSARCVFARETAKTATVADTEAKNSRLTSSDVNEDANRIETDSSATVLWWIMDVEPTPGPAIVCSERPHFISFSRKVQQEGRV